MMFKKFTPIDDKIFFEVDDMETESAGGIIMPDRHSERVRRGTVISVGPSVKDVKVGDRILIYWSTGTHIDHVDNTAEARDKFRVCREYNILGIITEE